MTTALRGQHRARAVSNSAYSCSCFGYSSWLPSLVMASENTPCSGLPIRAVIKPRDGRSPSLATDSPQQRISPRQQTCSQRSILAEAGALPAPPTSESSLLLRRPPARTMPQ